MVEENSKLGKGESWFKKNKKLSMGLFITIGLVALVSAGLIFFQSSGTLQINEARFTMDSETFALSGYSGESINHSTNLSNKGSVPVCTEISWLEVENVNLTSYEVFIGEDINSSIITVQPNQAVQTNMTFVISPITEAGLVEGSILYTKVECA